MSHANEIPSDEEVRSVLGSGAPMEAGDLLRALEARGFTLQDSRRAVRRCLDRGSIVLGPDLRLEVAKQLHAA